MLIRLPLSFEFEFDWISLNFGLKTNFVVSYRNFKCNITRSLKRKHSQPWLQPWWKSTVLTIRSSPRNFKCITTDLIPRHRCVSDRGSLQSKLFFNQAHSQQHWQHLRSTWPWPMKESKRTKSSSWESPKTGDLCGQHEAPSEDFTINDPRLKPESQSQYSHSSNRCMEITTTLF